MSKKSHAPLNIPRNLNLAAQALRGGDPNTAEPLLREVLARAPGNLQGLGLLGQLCLETAHYEEAADCAHRALGVNPKNGAFLLLLAEAQRRLGATAKAVNTLRTLIRMDGANIDALCNLGALLTEAGSYGEAETVLRSALIVAPGYPRLLGNLGTVLDRTNRTKEAIATYSQALEADHESRVIRLNLANSLVRDRQVGQAISHYRTVLAQFPDDADTWHTLGTTFHLMGAPLDAENCFRTALKLQPQRVDTHLDLANLLYDMGNGEEALSVLAKAATLTPGDQEIRIRTGEIYASLGRFDDALAMADAAATVPAPPSTADYRLASLFVTMGDATRARFYLDRYLAADPEDSLGGHLLLAEIGARNLPDQTPTKWLRSHYAEAAARWDRISRNYPPELVANAVRAELSGRHVEAVLDAGCGTGIVGALLADVAECIDGVDLSPEMIDSARAKNIYRDLTVGDLVEFLAKKPMTYDLIASAATLIHMSDLQPSLINANRALNPGGLFVFTLMRSDNAAIMVARFHGAAMDACFAHSRHYVQEVALAAGFEVRAIEDVVHELDRFQRPIPGLLVTLRKRDGVIG